MLGSMSLVTKFSLWRAIVNKPPMFYQVKMYGATKLIIALGPVKSCQASTFSKLLHGLAG